MTLMNGSPVARRLWLTAVGSAVAVTVSGCLGIASSEELSDERVEVFEFDMQPGTLTSDEVEARSVGMVAGGRVLPGSGVHRATVEVVGITIDFFEVQAVDGDLGPTPVVCTIRESSVGSGAGACGVDVARLNTDTIEVSGEEQGGTFSAAEFRVGPDVVKVVGSTSDGKTYTVFPANGLGYVDWRDERGPLDLTALDADGDVVGIITVGER